MKRTFTLWKDAQQAQAPETLSSCIHWPDIDRGGDYKDYIDELKGDLAWAMEITRNLLPEKQKILP